MRRMEPLPALLLSVVLVLTLLPVRSVVAAPDDAAIPDITGKFKSAAVMDARTGEFLMGHAMHRRLPPASMVKMMTELIVLEQIAEGEIAPQETVTVSAKASRMGGSQVYLKQGERFPVVELLEALAIQSANDAAVALAEHVAGSTEAFVEMMNARAAELGMRDTEFHSPHGLPPGRGQQPDLSSAHDMALLGRQICRFPEALHWAVSNRVPFRGGKFLLTNPNPLVGKLKGLEGIKTGFHSRAGYCLTAACRRKGVRLISVVMGCPTNRDRGVETTRLLARGFGLYTKVTLVPAAGDSVGAVPVRGGKPSRVTVTAAAPLVVGVRKALLDSLRLALHVQDDLAPPLPAGQPVGFAVARLDGAALDSVAVRTAAPVKKAGFWDRLLGR